MPNKKCGSFTSTENQVFVPTFSATVILFILTVVFRLILLLNFVFLDYPYIYKLYELLTTRASTSKTFFSVLLTYICWPMVNILFAIKYNATTPRYLYAIKATINGKIYFICVFMLLLKFA